MERIKDESAGLGCPALAHAKDQLGVALLDAYLTNDAAIASGV
jgi:hypothetical protein